MRVFFACSQGKFIEDRWERENDGGYGITRVLEGGNVWVCPNSGVKIK
jgi:coproporphyrinogen III oxidase